MTAPPLSVRDRDDLHTVLDAMLRYCALKPLSPSQKRIRELASRLRHKDSVSDDDVREARVELNKIMGK